MDEPKPVPPQTDATQGPIMDIQPPVAGSPESAVRLPDATPPPQDATPQPTEQSNHPPSPTAALTPEEQASQTAVQPKKPKGPVLAVVAAIVVFVALSAGAVYMYKNQTTDAPRQEATTTDNDAIQQPATAPATVEDVDTTSEDIDKAINELDDTKDFSDDNVSDDTLGL